MSIAAAALGLSREFTFSGVTYTLKPLTYESLARFSLWLEDRAKAAVERAGASAEAAYGVLLDKIAACEFEPGSATFDAATRSNPGRRLLLELSLDGADAESVSWEVYADETAFEQAMAIVGELNRDPKAKAARRTPGAQQAALSR